MKLFKKNSKKNTGLLHATTLKAYRDDYLNKSVEREKARTKNWVTPNLPPTSPLSQKQVRTDTIVSFPMTLTKTR